MNVVRLPVQPAQPHPIDRLDVCEQELREILREVRLRKAPDDVAKALNKAVRSVNLAVYRLKKMIGS